MSSPIENDPNTDFYSFFDSKFDNLNKKIINGDIPTNKFTKIIKMAESIERTHAHRLEKEKFMRISPRVWQKIGYGVSGLAFIGSGANFVSTIINSKFQNDTNCDYPAEVIGANIASSSIAMISGLGLGFFSYIDSKRSSHNQEIEKKLDNVRMIKLLLMAFSQIIQPIPDSDKNHEVADEKLQKCVRILEDLPREQISNEARDRWISAILQSLPEGSDLKTKLEKLHAIALQKKSQKTESSDESSDGSSYETTLDKPIEEEDYKGLKRRPSDGTEGFDISANYSGQFLTDNHADKLFRHSTESCYSEKTKKSISKIYQEAFSDLENDLGLPIEELNCKGLYFTKIGKVSEKRILKSDKKYNLDLKITK